MSNGGIQTNGIMAIAQNNSKVNYLLGNRTTTSLPFNNNNNTYFHECE